MTEEAGNEAEKKPGKSKSLLLVAVATIALAGGGFASTYFGFLSPGELLAKKEHVDDPFATIDFVELPPIVTTITGQTPRQVRIVARLEVEAGNIEVVEKMLPRVSDAFNSFMAGIDPAAFDKRGVLEVIRAEMVTRTGFALGEGMIRDVLITEFAIK